MAIVKWLSFFIAIVGVSVAARADDYAALLAEAQKEGRVDALVTQWRPITGEIDPLDLQDVVTGAPDNAREQRTLMKKIAEQGGRVEELRRYKYLRLQAVRLDESALKAVKALPDGYQLWRNRKHTFALTDSTEQVGAVSYWDKGATGDGQVVAVLDTGVDAAHPFLKGKVVREACFSFRSCPNGQDSMVGPGAARPLHFHGTHVAGIIAGQSGRAAGVAPDAGIAAVNVFSLDPSTGGIAALDTSILAGMDYILQLIIEQHMPVAAVNASLGGGHYAKRPCDRSPYQLVAKTFELFDTAFIAAAGNEGHKAGLPTPACAGNVISVGAVDKNGRIASFSNSAGYLDILAPGVKIYSSVTLDGEYGLAPLDGTSMAAPHVAGAFALMRASRPDMSVRSILKALQSKRRVTDVGNGLATPVLNLGGADEPGGTVPITGGGGAIAITE